jgi:hypothetical protein
MRERWWLVKWRGQSGALYRSEGGTEGGIMCMCSGFFVILRKMEIFFYEIHYKDCQWQVYCKVVLDFIIAFKL